MKTESHSSIKFIKMKNIKIASTLILIVGLFFVSSNASAQQQRRGHTNYNNRNDNYEQRDYRKGRGSRRNDDVYENRNYQQNNSYGNRGHYQRGNSCGRRHYGSCQPRRYTRQNCHRRMRRMHHPIASMPRRPRVQIRF